MIKFTALLLLMNESDELEAGPVRYILTPDGDVNVEIKDNPTLEEWGKYFETMDALLKKLIEKFYDDIGQFLENYLANTDNRIDTETIRDVAFHGDIKDFVGAATVNIEYGEESEEGKVNIQTKEEKSDV